MTNPNPAAPLTREAIEDAIHAIEGGDYSGALLALRVAQEAAVRATSTPAGHALHFDPDCEECAYLARPTRETIRATSTPAGLDVETLQYALERVDPVAFALDGTAATDREVVDHFRYAHAIAREYAALQGAVR